MKKMINTQEQNKTEQTEWCYLCTFCVPFRSFGTGIMIGAYSKLMNSIPKIEGELKEQGWDVRKTICDSGGKYFDGVFYNYYEARMSGSKSRDIPKGTLEKITSKHGVKLLHCT